MANSKYNGKQIMHGMSNTPEYRTRIRILNRCHDPNYHGYHKYGGRGITVCKEWRDSFETFYRDMGPRPSSRHSIERIENNGNYEPGNCKWALPLEQMRNTRWNHYITFNNETLCISEWASRIGIGHSAFAKRVKLWGIEKAITTPKQTHHDNGEAVRRAFAS